MSLRAVLSTDSEFAAIAQRISEDIEKSEGHMFFLDDQGCLKYHFQHFGCTIKRLKSIDSRNESDVAELLGYLVENGRFHSQTFPEIGIVEIDALQISFTIREDFLDDGSGENAFKICIQYHGKRREDGLGIRGGKQSAYFIYVEDCTPAECCEWARGFQETVRRLCSQVEFWNSFGNCKGCKAKTHPKEFTDLLSLCPACLTKESERIRLEEMRRKERRRLKALQKKIDKGISVDLIASERQMVMEIPAIALSPRQKVLISKELRHALHRVYRGRCQYCPYPYAMPLADMHIDHIIPSGVSLECIRDEFKDAIPAPPLHDCVLNYTIACSKHNLAKGARIFSSVALEFLLKQARSKAKKVLALYQREIQEMR